MRQTRTRKTVATSGFAAVALVLAACGSGPGGDSDGADGTGDETEEGLSLSQEEAVEVIGEIAAQVEAGELEYDPSASSDEAIEALQEAIPRPSSGYPARDIEVLIGFGEGGGSDQYARNISQDAQRIMGVSLVMNNVPGASGEVALGQLFSGPKDGYTIATVITNQVINDALDSQPYDFVEDVDFVIRQQGPTETYWVRADNEWETFEDMLEYAADNPGQVTVSGSGVGSDDEFRLYALGQELDTSFNFVPYDGVGGRTTALLGGDIDILHETAGTVIDLYETGDIRPLAYGGDIVFDAIDPDIPSVAELGYPVPTGRWRGIVVPPEVDQETVDYLHHVFYAASQLPRYKEYEVEFFQDVAGGYLNSAEFEEAARQERDDIIAIIEDLGL